MRNHFRDCKDYNVWNAKHLPVAIKLNFLLGIDDFVANAQRRFMMSIRFSTALIRPKLKIWITLVGDENLKFGRRVSSAVSNFDFERCFEFSSTLGGILGKRVAVGNDGAILAENACIIAHNTTLEMEKDSNCS